MTAFVRDPSKLSGDLKVSQVISGDVTNPSDVDKAIAGQDGVVIVLGTRNDLGPSTIMSDGTKNIIDSMKNHGVNRVSACLSCKFINHMELSVNVMYLFLFSLIFCYIFIKLFFIGNLRKFLPP